MRIAVLADTHDRLPPHVRDAIAGADEIWHLGDVCSVGIEELLEAIGPPLRIVGGNCDSDLRWPLALDLQVEGWRVHLVHIPPRVPPPDVDLLLHGHTHVPRNEVISGVRFLNPGCITRPNRGAPASYAWLELRHGEALQWQLMRV